MDEFDKWCDCTEEHEDDPDAMTWKEWKEKKWNVLKRHSRGEKVEITEQAISKVKKVKVPEYTQEMTEKSAERRQELLEYALQENGSNEVAGLIDLSTGKTTPFVKGSNNSVDFLSQTDIYHLIKSSPAKSLELIHNHPGASYFSMNDLNVFMGYSAIKTITIVTNKGKIWYLKKTEKYDFSSAVQLMRDLSSRFDDNDELIEEFLKQAYNLGIRRN